MTELIVIAALANNGVIGRKNDIPWRISADFQRFKRLTLGHPCIMGQATYESLPEKSRPLPGRENIVLSLDPSFFCPQATQFSDFEAALRYVRERGEEKAFITGGATIYRLALPFADTLELTHIHHDYEGTVYFPPFEDGDFELVSELDQVGQDSLNQREVRFSYRTYRRRQSAVDRR